MVLLSGRCLEVKCDMESTVGAVFDAVVSFANLGDATYFGLAYAKGGCLWATTQCWLGGSSTQVCSS